ncbi:MAG: PAS domain S-box protein [Deltaproteobacteria bacterium]|nr:PAS domain S-box protein [Deltaproteobacteria bacterium]
MDEPEPEKPTTGRIVGIGASAGGLESLEQLFGSLPADTGMAFIVVQHLSPDFRSLMDELIARHSDMPVQIAQEGMPVRPDHIYLMPPRKEMIIRDRHLVLTDKEPHTFSLPIDTFFRSLAQDCGDQAVAVVLSGSGSDGSRGIVDVKRAGGLVMAESPVTAKFDGMPMSAAATGVVEHVHGPRDIARVLCGLPPLDPTDTDIDTLSDDPAMDSVFRMLRDQFGIDFSIYKTSTVGRRIQRRVDLLRFHSLAEYVAQLDADELNALYHDLLIGVTQFFRDPGAFELLEKEIIPQLLEKTPITEEIRVWVAGCATGEEAYSLAMLFWEAMTARNRPILLKILATDVHQQSLEHASAGVYGEEQLANVSHDRMARFFTRRSSGYQVSQDLRQLIVFARHNLTKDAPFTKMHFISCRNMLIYLQPHAQRTVFSLFHFGLVSGGVMFLGASETPGSLADEFTVLDEHWKVYRKRRDVQLLSQVRLPMQRPSTRRSGPVDLPRTRGADPLILQTYDQLLDKFMPPGFLVDEDRNLVDSFAGAEKLLKPRRRRPSSNLLDLLDDELRSIVAGAIQRAFKERAAVVYTGVPLTTEDGEVRSTLSAEPLFHPRTGVRHVLVSFKFQAKDEAPRPGAMPAPRYEVSADEATRERMDTLETELGYTRETLQATIEELETSNEEMQATNEELVASNEELQSTNEELHSVNEELYTVNAEYQQKIAELKELNTDMQHLLEGTDVGTVFLDKELRIRRFTSRIASVFRFIAQDVGRFIGDFSHNIERDGLIDEIQRARVNGETIEDEVRDSNGTPYFLRILPYRVKQDLSPRGELAIEGVVLTITNITALDKARSRLAQLSAIVESSDDAIVGKALDGTITTWNKGAEQMYGYTAEEAIGQNVSKLMAPGAESELASAIERIKLGERVDHMRSLRVRKDGTRLDVSVTMSPILDASGELCGVSAIARDISAMVQAHRELEERQQEIATLLAQTKDGALRREQFLAMLSHELRNPLAAVLNATTLLKRSIEPPTIGRCQAVIERQAKHMKRLLDDLLDVSRITRGKFELRFEDIELRQPIEAAIESVQPLFGERRVELISQLPNRAMPVRGDANRLMQVVVNLLSNAANYSPRNSKVRLLVAVEGDAAVLRVLDHGVGIELELQEKIFDLFVQSEQRLDRSRGGLGVGLSLARNIVEQHGGKIEVQSDGAGKGADFKVTIPLGVHAADAWGEAVPAGIRTTPNRRRVLVVDDQEDAREMLKMLLESRDHTVFDAADGPSALDVLQRERPDVAFIDIGLPVMTGYEVAQKIRADQAFDDVTLVALTGYGAPSDQSAALAAGFDEHLIKPAELAKIEKILMSKKPQLTGS